MTTMMDYVVKAVEPEENYTLVIDFVDGSKKRFDMKPIIDKGGVFAKLSDIDVFKTAHVDRDTVSWDEVLDIAPETLYEKGVAIV